jgi:FMN-dependent oxidoreductase (nitrilotriacetate monooxygenase family)
MTHQKFHLAYFTKFGATAWPGTATGFGSTWADGSFHVELAKKLEDAKFDFVLFEDGVTISDHYGGSMELDLKHAVLAPKHDPLPLLPLMANGTSHLGLIATASTSFYPPFLLARLYSTLDSLTGGRVGWNIVTSSEDNAARNFGMDSLPSPTERYDRAEEYVELVTALWDSWEEGALVADVTTGVYVDHTKVHTINFEGKHHKSRGPLNTLRSPQGRPVFAQAGASTRGRDFAAKNAEVVVAPMSGGIAGMQALRADIRGRAESFGRDPDDIKVFFLTSSLAFTTGDDSADGSAMSDQDAQAALEYGMVMLSSATDIDFSTLDLDSPVPQDLEAKGHTSILDAFKALGAEGVTLREAMTSSAGQDEFGLVGTPQHVAQRLIEIMDEVGGDGFLIEGSGLTASIDTVVDELVPTLQEAGVVRTEYTGTTLREILYEF